MVKYVTGDLLAADSEALVNSVNCVGVMGRGVALAFKRRFPDNFKAYKAACAIGANCRRVECSCSRPRN